MTQIYQLGVSVIVQPARIVNSKMEWSDQKILLKLLFVIKLSTHMYKHILQIEKIPLIYFGKLDKKEHHHLQCQT